LRISDWFGKSVQDGLPGMRSIGRELRDMTPPNPATYRVGLAG
jgi:hypothetical protein